VRDFGFMCSWIGPVCNGTPGELGGARGIAVDTVGNVYVADSDQVKVFSPSGTFSRAWGGTGSASGQFRFSSGGALEFGPDGLLYVADGGNGKIQVFDPTTGAFVRSWGPLIDPYNPGLGTMSPFGIGFRVQSSLPDIAYVAHDTRLLRFTLAGGFLGNAMTPQSPSTGVRDLAFDSGGDLYLTEGIAGPSGSRLSRLAPAVVIRDQPAPQLWVEILGRNQVRFGERSDFWIIVANTGDADAFDLLLQVKIPSGLEFEVRDVDVPAVAGVDFQSVPLGPVVGLNRLVPLWIYDLPKGTTRIFSISVRAPSVPGVLEVGAELWQTGSTEFRRTGDLTSIGLSFIYSVLSLNYAFAADYITDNAVSLDEYVERLPSWLQGHVNSLRMVPLCFASVAAAADISGRAISGDAARVLCDPFRETASPFWRYGYYCGTDWNDILDPEDIDHDGVTVEPNGVMDETPIDSLDNACRNHDIRYDSIHCDGDWDGPGGIFNANPCGPIQDEIDDQLCVDARSIRHITPSPSERTAARQVEIAFCDWIFDPDEPEDPPEPPCDPAADEHCDPSDFPIPRPPPSAGPSASGTGSASVTGARDPNDKVGPTGFGPSKFISSGHEIFYVVSFENKADATASARDIVVADRLDEGLDWGTLKLRGSSHPGNLQTGFDPSSGTVTWAFLNINLAPNRIPPEGEGWVMFSVMPRNDLVSGTAIVNHASIVFDFNPAEVTREVVNVLDLLPPTSSVKPLPATIESSSSFEVQWEGDDGAGSGIRSFRVFVSRDLGAFVPWLVNTASTSAIYTGESGHTYSFFSVATDNVGNSEAAPTHPDAITQVRVSNLPPVAIVSRPTTDEMFSEGEVVLFDGSESFDPEGALVSYEWDFGDGWTGIGPSVEHAYRDNGIYRVILRVVDNAGLMGTTSTTVISRNAAPSVTISGPAPLPAYALDAPINFVASFTDPGIADTHTAEWTFTSWDASTSFAGSLVEQDGSGTVMDAFRFGTPGIYLVTLTVTDDDGDSATATRIGEDRAVVIVYDSEGGSVTGGGTLDSEAGGFLENPSLTGRANFGFVAKYQAGEVLPEGQLEFNFPAADVNFHSISYDWLVVSGSKGALAGSGTINGGGNYGFLLVAVDNGAGHDGLRIRIWDKTTNAVIYDTDIAQDPFTLPTAPLSGGNIDVHKS